MKLFIVKSCADNKNSNFVVEYCCLFAKHFFDLISLNMANRHPFCFCTSDRKHFTRLSEASVSRKPKPGPVLVLVSV